MRGIIFFAPKDEGGLSLMNISAQQKSLQVRLIEALLRPINTVAVNVPFYLYHLMVSIIQISYDCPCHEIPLLFPSARVKGS